MTRSHKDPFWVVLILLGAFALRVHALGAKSLWYDELRQVEVAQRPITQLQPLLLAHAARPLDYVLTHYWLVGGHQEFWLRFPALLWSTLAVAAAFALGRRLLGRRAALAATALLAASGLGVQYAQELRPYALYLLIALLAFYCLERALAQPSAMLPWAGFAAASALGTLTHFFYAFLLAAQTAYGAGVLLRRRPGWRSLAALAAASALGFAALAVAARPVQLLGFAQSFLRALGMAPAAGALVSSAGTAVAVTETVNADFFLKGLLPPMGGGPGPAALLLFNGLALAGLVLLAVRSSRRLALALLWLAAAPGLIIVYLQYRQQFFALRYILFALPVYLMLIAHAVDRLWPRAANGRGQAPNRWAGLRWAAGAGLLAVLLLELGQVREGYRTPKDDWRRVGQFLTANTRPGDTLGAPDVQAFIRFYAPSQKAAIVDANDLGPHQEALANGERFWFVWSEYTLLPVDETRQWALSLPGVTFELDPKIKVIFVHPGLSQAEALREAESFAIPARSIP